MTTGVEAATALVVTVKGALVAAAGTVTVAGTDAAGLSLERETAAPPFGAGPLNVTVPLDGLVPVTLVGSSVSETSDGSGGVSVPSTQNSKKLNDQPLPSPTLVVAMRRYLP